MISILASYMLMEKNESKLAGEELMMAEAWKTN